MQTSTWYGCYDETLKAFITPASFAHPAKMAKRLCERIYEHGAAQGYWQPGDLILDPFGGIGTTGLIGAYRGYRVISIELEPHFFALQQANIKKNAPKLKRLGLPIPIVIQGDSRQASRLVAEAIGSIFPPPYADGSAHTGGNDPHPKRMTGGEFHGVGMHGSISSPPYADSVNGGEGPGARYDFVTHSPDNAVKQTSDAKYGSSDGQIGALREGDFDRVVGIVSSPPYSESLQGTQNGIDWSKLSDGGKRQTESRAAYGGEYGVSAGQIGALKEGEFENVVGAISSPPYSENVKHDYTHDDRDARRLGEGFTGRGKGSFRGSENYGKSEGQIGRMREGEFESVVGAVTSPPWEDTLSRDVVNAEARRDYARSHGISNAEHVSPVDMERIGQRDQEYGNHPGQIGTLSGGFDEVIGAITSPPYEASVNQSDGANDSAARLARKAQAGVDVTQAVKRGGPNSVLNQPQVYGDTEGQIGALSGGYDEVVGALTSPPYEKDALGHAGGEGPRTTHAAHSKPGTPNSQSYGETDGNIGQENSQNYWQAMAQVYGELYRVLRPGGVAAIVVKDFVRNKQIVPLCDRTAQLLEALGFTIVERTHAMLTKETPLGLDMFTGTHATKTTSRKSFFRRLAEKNGSPAIDYEEVIWAQKTSGGGTLNGAITSPPYEAMDTCGNRRSLEMYDRGEKRERSYGNSLVKKD